jgi:hypothetical protein
MSTTAGYFIVLVIFFIKTTEALAAPECYPANTVLAQMDTQGYKSHLIAVQIGNPPPAPSDRGSLEGLVKLAINAQQASSDAVSKGRIQDSERGDYVNKLRRLAYLTLKEKNSTIWAVLVYLRAKDNKGVILLRAMTFPYEGKQGEELVGGSEICIETRLHDVVVNPAESVSASDLLSGNESPDCSGLPSAVAASCTGLSKNLAAARASGETVALTAHEAAIDGKTSSVISVITWKRSGGRILSSSANGTSLVANFLFSTGL